MEQVRHVAVIMDGNGRWAKKRGQRREYGHRAGRKAVSVGDTEWSSADGNHSYDNDGPRRDLILNLLNDIEGFECNVPDGAFYVFPDISYFFGKEISGIKINNASDMSMFLLENALVATVTGDAFGNPNCIRISYAASKEKITEAVNRIKKLLK